MKKFTTILFFIVLICSLPGFSKEVPESYPRNVFLDELTGTWCKWCIYGIVNLENAMEEYGDRLIIVSVHGGDDVMKDQEYCTAVEKLGGFISYPNAIFNRNKNIKGAPKEDLLSKIPELLATGAPAEMSLGTEFINDSNSLSISTQIRFAAKIENKGWHLSYVIVEDSVHQPDNPLYIQQNGYAGGGSGEMGGYEDKPAFVPASDMYYRYVARGSVGGFNGIAESLPFDIESGKIYTHEYEFELPDNIIEKDNCHLIALLLDSENQVQQAERIKFGHSMPALQKGSSSTLPIEVEETDGYQIYMPNGIRVDKPVKGINIIRHSNGKISKILVK